MNDLSCLWSTLLFLLVIFLCGCHEPIEENSLARSCILTTTERRIYISTVDGILTALNEQGQVLWRYSAREPLFSSSLKYGESEEVVNLIIPGLDRGIYRWDGRKLSQFPFTADDLIDNAHLHRTHGSFLAGAKANDVVGLDINTGKPIYECTQHKCHRYDNQSLIQQIDVLKLSISRVTIREASDLTGQEMWNFTVGESKLVLIEGDEGRMGQSCNTFESQNWDLHVDTLEGLLYATDRLNSGHLLWKVELEAPVVKVWLQEGGKLELVELFHQSQRPVERAEPSLIMLHYNNHYYLQPLQHSGKPRPRIAASGGQLLAEEDLMEVPVQQYSVGSQVIGQSSCSLDSTGRNKDLMLYHDKDAFWEMCTEGPYGVAVYFYMDPLPYQDVTGGENDSVNSQNKCVTPPEAPPSDYEKAGHHWLVQKFLSLMKYVLFGAFVLACNKLRRYLKFRRKRMSSNSSNSTSLDDEEFEDEEFLFLDQIIESIKRSSSLTESVSTPTVLSSPNSSTETLRSLGRSDSIPEPRVLPRFGSDYELKGRLGKGGFGVVYHVQNKTDGGEYAVKRIKLPSNKAAKEKVMREVRALAQLDHPRIVRYYNSWVEKAPIGWNQMEEWMPISRKSSNIQELVLSSTPTSTNPTNSSLLPPPHPPSLTRPQNISPCPSFTSLNHSIIHSIVPPPLTIDSRNSSFDIEFRDDSSHLNPDGQLSNHGNVSDLSHHGNVSDLSHHGNVSDLSLSSIRMTVSDEKDSCFSQALLSNRDELSSGSSQSTEDKEERRDSITALGVEPPTYLFIQMQLCQKESLKDWLKTNVTNRNHANVLHFFEQILDAVMYVHEKGMMHRDLKPSNIFFSLDGTIKVGDFGLVTSSVYGGLQSSYLALKALGEDMHRQHTGNLGSHFYMSPEQISGKKYNQKVDIFSLGIIFFELHYPFHTEMERAKVLEDVRHYKFPTCFEKQLPLEADLVKWLMAHHANNRPAVKDIYASDKFKQLHRDVGVDTIIPKL